MKREKISGWLWRHVIRKKVAAVMRRMYPEDRMNRHLMDFYGRKFKMLMVGLGILMIFSGILTVSEYVRLHKEQTKLIRASPGSGEIIYHLTVSDGEYYEDQEVDIHVPARLLDEKELEEWFSLGWEWVSSHWLGENKSASQVYSDLDFTTEIPEYDMTVQWRPENTAWIRSDGTVTDEAYESAPVTTRVFITLQCQGETREHVEEITLQKPVLLPAQAGMKEIMDAVNDKIEATATEETLSLPTSVDGRKLTWKTVPDHMGIKFLIFGCLCLAVFFFYKDEQVIRQFDARSRELERAYPEIVYRLVLLMGAGLTIRRAWEKVVEKGLDQDGSSGMPRAAYKEMERTIQEMNRGITERQAYVNFGRRCGSPAYMRLAALLVQQLQKGTKGSTRLLLNEAEEAEIMRRENARKMGEQASLKMLFPLILLMGIIFAILIYPAVVSFKI